MDLKSIHEIFTNRILRIPSYQRGYSWANNKPISEVKVDEFKSIKGQLMDLWGDIVNIPDDKWHYTGLLTLVETKTSDYSWLPNYKQFAIVDGQQRITSILILITVMVEQADKLSIELGVREGDTKFQYLYINKNGLNAYVFGYDQDNPSDKYFRQHILGLNEIEDDSRESVYTENLKKAKAFFERMVQQYLLDEGSQKNRLQALFSRVTGNLRFNEYILPKELDEYVVFETMNNRGKPLSELEKLKNRLMYLSDKFEVNGGGDEDVTAAIIESQKNKLCQSINRGWITIYQSLGADKKSPLDDNSFIKAHWITFFDRYNRSKSNAHATHLFNEYFTLEKLYDGTLTPDSIREYVKSLQRCAVIWNKIHHPIFFESTENTEKRAVQGLQRVGFRASFSPLVLAALLQGNKDDFCVMLQLLEGYAFKIFHISDRQSNTGDSKLYRLASQVYHSNITPEDACAEIQGHINHYYSFSLFKNQIQELFESGNQLGFYEWSGLRYFLFEYDQQLRTQNRTSTHATELIWKDFSSKDTIEHIYPQSAAKSFLQFCNGKESNERREAYETLQNDWSSFSEYSPEQRKRLCNSLGNLLAISHSDNASFNNDRFDYKVDQSNKGDTYRSRGYRYDSMSAQIVAKSSEWTPEAIKERGILMLKTMLSMLNEPLDLLCENDALKLLGLEFMIKIDNHQQSG
jgi:hypothetical protein